MKYQGLPIYQINIDDNTEGMYTISLVDRPATETPWLAFDEQEKPMSFSVVDEEERKVLTVVMRADFPIYRCDEYGREFYVVFTKDTIETMVQKFLKNSYQNFINVDHIEGSYISDVEPIQFFIKDTEKGINPKGFESIEEGSLFAVYKITTDALWAEIKKGTFTSVSLEGMFNLIPFEAPETKEETVIDTVEDLIDYLTH